MLGPITYSVKSHGGEGRSFIPDALVAAIGISVDDTIHHVTRFRLEFRRCRSSERALYASMVEVGRALFITSVVLLMGFLVFQFSALDTLLIFGALLATTIGVALVADFLLMPALALTWKPFGPEVCDR